MRRIPVALALLVALAAAMPSSAQPLRSATLLSVPDGEPVRLEPGAPLLHVVFFAAWCRPCVAELEPLGELEARWSDRGYRLVLIGVSSRQDVERLAELVARRGSLPGELLFDSDGSVQAAFKADLLPTHLLFDAEGRELMRAGALDGELARTIDARMAATGGPRGRRR